MADEPQAPPEVPAEAHAIPQLIHEEAKRQAQHLFGIQLQTGPAPNAFLEKFQPEHIKQVLDSAEKENLRRHVTQRSMFGGVMVSVLVLCALFIFTQNAAMLEKVLALLFGFSAGWAGGYGYSKTRS